MSKLQAMPTWFNDMGTGLALAGTGWLLGASIDYNRFIKLWMLRPAPYSKRARIVFRIMFAIWVVSGIFGVLDMSKHSLTNVIHALPYGVGWFLVIAAMVYVGEWPASTTTQK